LIEADVKRAVKAYLKNLGAYQFWPVQTGYGSATIDCLVCYRGRFYGIETKRPGVKEPTPRQGCVMREITEAGGEVCLENSPGLEAVRKLLS
jgi:hypothetical protein